MKTERLIGILTILLRHEKVTTSYLSEKFEVSQRTINRDIDAICLAGIPIVTERGCGGVSIMDGYKIDSPDMQSSIGELWQKLFTDEMYPKIKGKKNEKALGIYTDYEQAEKGGYTVIAGCETEGSGKLPSGMVETKIPAGKYAKFVVHGHMERVVSEFWEKLWNMDLPRTFVCDFEEYQNGDMENTEIHIYIGIK